METKDQLEWNSNNNRYCDSYFSERKGLGFLKTDDIVSTRFVIKKNLFCSILDTFSSEERKRFQNENLGKNEHEASQLWKKAPGKNFFGISWQLS